MVDLSLVKDEDEVKRIELLLVLDPETVHSLFLDLAFWNEELHSFVVFVCSLEGLESFLGHDQQTAKLGGLRLVEEGAYAVKGAELLGKGVKALGCLLYSILSIQDEHKFVVFLREVFRVSDLIDMNAFHNLLNGFQVQLLRFIKLVQEVISYKLSQSRVAWW